MKLEILGTGCARCSKLEEHTRKAAAELGLDAEISKVKEINKIMELGVMITPALAVDGKVVVAGKVPSVDEIKKLIKK